MIRIERWRLVLVAVCCSAVSFAFGFAVAVRAIPVSYEPRNGGLSAYDRGRLAEMRRHAEKKLVAAKSLEDYADPNDPEPQPPPTDALDPGFSNFLRWVNDWNAWQDRLIARYLSDPNRDVPPADGYPDVEPPADPTYWDTDVPS